MQTAVPAAPVKGGSHFDGSIPGLLRARLGSMLFTVITLGFGLPWSTVWWHRWVTKHTVINGYRLRFTGTGRGLRWRWFKMNLLILVTLGIYSLWAWRYIQRWKVEHTEFAV